MKNLDKDLQTIINIFEALKTLTLTGYTNQKTNINCIEALQGLYENLNVLNKEIKELNKNQKEG